MENSLQQGLFPEDRSNAQAYALWKHTPGGRHIMRMIYRTAAFYGARYRRTGQRVSVDFILHQIRDRLKEIKTYLARRGVTLPSVGGYRLNNNFTAYLARDIEAHRPEWAGMFEKRRLAEEREAVAA